MQNIFHTFSKSEVKIQKLKNNIHIDLSNFNMFDSVKIATYYMTCHFLNYKSGKIHFYLKDENTRKLIAPLKLKNTILDIKNSLDEVNIA